MPLSKYLEAFQNVRPNRTNGRASPHKVCMLYAVMDLVEEGRLTENKIPFTYELKNRFAWHFEKLKTEADMLNPVNPFFYLRSSDFWHHSLRSGKEGDYEQLKSPSEKSLHDIIEYAFLDPELFELLQDPVSSARLGLALSENLDTREEGFKRWALAIGKSEKTVSNYSNALKGSISNWLSDAGLLNRNLLTISDYFELTRIAKNAVNEPQFTNYNTRGNGMYSAALNLYRQYLDELTDASIEQDVQSIEQDAELKDTQKKVLVQARRGQGKFRERVISQWKKCAVTGYDNISLLLASHIKPWAVSDNGERLDPYNGLLLSPNLDKAFDLNYVSFSDKGRILISDQLGEYATLGIDKDMKVPLLEQHQDYMAYHREIFHTKGALVTKG
ncbi:restriction endonuclease [Aliidiomarina minuta]|uniref:Restriction endonuclease n=1 Tax=Aliidiomarina minuta TaxID=880057 RepID=A0A432W3I9_9GAMM|nr:HNH endonuclease [Aliidiomarina minuta]RUO23923.1 restriction endonuclease [Aliidiomarina minuta]